MSFLKTALRSIQRGAMRCILWAEHFASLWKIAWRSIQQRALASVLTAVSMGLAVALVVAVLVIYDVVEQSFNRGGKGYDLLVGKGGELEMVLSSVFYLQQPAGNIPASYRDDLLEGRVGHDVLVKAAIPICVGHNSDRGFRIVGTVPEMFEKLTDEDGRKIYKFDDGDPFKLENHFDAVIGSTVARETRLKVGQTFEAPHGVGEGTADKPPEFTVVGILAHSGTPNDRAMLVNIEGFYAIHPAKHDDEAHDDHAHDDHAHDDHAHDDGSRPISALLVCIDRSASETALPEAILQTARLEREIDNGSVAQAVIPRTVITRLFEGILGKLQWILLIMAVLIVVVAGLGIMVSIYNSMSDRRHEIAVMRALGAGRLTVMTVILLESILLSLGGGVLGLLLGHGLIAALSPIIIQQTGVAVGLFDFRTIELLLIPGLIVLASLVGYLPAVAAYRTDVARSLTATP